MNTISIKVEVLEEEHLILSKIQSEIKEETGKKVALSKILLEFFKKGLEEEQKVDFAQNKSSENNETGHFAQNKIANNDTKDCFTQNKTTESSEKTAFTQNLVENIKEKTHFTQEKSPKINKNEQINNLSQHFNQNEQNLEKRWNKRFKKLELKEKELNQEREELFEKRWKLVRMQEKITAKYLETKEKDLIIEKLNNEIKTLSYQLIETNKKWRNELDRKITQNFDDIENYKNKIYDYKTEIIKLKSERQNMLDKLSDLNHSLKDLKYLNKSLSNSFNNFAIKGGEKTIFEQIEPFLPALATLGVLIIKDEKIIETIKKQFPEFFPKEKDTKNND